MASPQQSSLAIMRQFEFREETDFPGGDYSDVEGNPIFRGITVGRCAELCTLINTCVGFTYNEKARFCFPKHSIERAEAFKGAISAVKQSHPAPPIVDNGFSPYLLKSSCGDVSSQMSALASKVDIKYAANGLAVQTPANISIRTPNFPDRLPAFLVVSFDQPVRFRGDGFYVLAPAASGAFGSKYEIKRTRVVIPLFAKGRSASLDLTFIPLVLAPMNIATSLIAQSGCGEITKAISSESYDIPRTGQPKVFVYDQFGSTAPTERIGSPNGDRYLDAFSGYFRIVSSSTNAPIAEIPGTQPRFSPTGRFVTAEFFDGVRIFDSVDGSALASVGYNVAWDVGDSFVIGDRTVWGQATIKSPFVEPEKGGELDNDIIRVGMSCHICQAIHSLAIKIDLENNHVIGHDQDGGTEYALSLTTPTPSDSEKTTAENVVARATGILPVKLPTRWETRDPLGFTNLAVTRGGKSPHEVTGDEAHLAQKFLLSPSRLPVPETLPSDRNKDKQEALLARLKDQFGMLVTTGSQFEALGKTFYDSSKEAVAEAVGIPVSNKDLLLKGDCAHGDGHEDSEGAHSADFWRIERSGETITLIGFGCNFGTTGYTGHLGAIHTTRDPGVVRQIASGVAYHEEYTAGGGCGGDCGFAAELIADRYVLAWAHGNEAIAFYDLRENKLAAISAYRGRLMQRAYLTADSRNIVQVNSDGTFAIYSALGGQGNAEDVKLALSIGGNDDVTSALHVLGHYDDDELVVWEPGGNFDAGYEASHQIVLKFDGSDAVFDFGQFASSSQKPGLFERALRGEVEAQRGVYSVPPIISARYTAQKDGRLRVGFSLQGGGKLRLAKVFQDGLKTSEHKLDGLKRSWELNVELETGVRFVSVVVVDDEGFRSAPRPFDLGKPKTKRDLKVLAIAVDDYTDPKIAGLSYSKTDAFTFSEAIKSLENKKYGSVSIEAVADADATAERVKEKIGEVLEQGDADTDVMLYFAGHGLSDKEGQLFLGLTETKADDLKATALGWSQISELLATATARVTVFLDTCHSGSAGHFMFSTNDAVASTLLKSSGSVTVLSASKGRQSSVEDSAEGGGVFTKALVDTITNSGSDADLNMNGSIEVSEVYRRIKSQVARKTNSTQTPWLAVDQAVGDRPIF
jgi:hypothetical protein